MPAGDLIDRDYQWEQRGLLTGAATPYQFAGPITGVGNSRAKTNDTNLEHAGGFYAGPDYSGGRILTVPYSIDGAGDAAVAGALFMALCDAWLELTTGLLEVHFRLPGIGHRKILGRPRHLVDDLTRLPSGYVRALGTFECPTRTMTVVP